MFSHFIDASYGSIYPALSALHSEGYISCKAETQEGRPGKKIYSITEKGRSCLINSLGTTQVVDKFKSEYLFSSLLSELMPAQQINELYEKRLEYLRGELEEIETILSSSEHASSRFVAGYGKAVVSAGLKYMEENKPETSTPPIKDAEWFGGKKW